MNDETHTQPAARTTLDIEGMHCGSCATHVQKALQSVTGVSDASVNFATHRAAVEHDPQATSIEQLIQSVCDAGYAASPVADPAGAAAEGRGTPSPHAADHASHAHDHGDDEQLRGMSRRLIVGAIIGAPLIVIAMSEHIPGLDLTRLASLQAWSWVQLALATPIVLYCGSIFFARGWRGLRNGTANMFTLIAIGVAASFVYSLVATVAPQLFPAQFHLHDGVVAVYYEAAAFIIILVLLGQVLEARAQRKTGDAIRALLDLTPRQARRILDDGSESDVALEQVQVGDRLRIRPGEKVPTDGQVLEGASAIDESMITGEPMPVQKQAGEPVIGGTLNTTGAMIMRAEAVGRDTMLAQIVRLVSEAQGSRAPIQGLADRVAAVFVPAVLGISLVTFVVWLLVGPIPAFAYALINTVSVLIIACPCALGLATPLSVMVGIGRGATSGVLIANAEALQILERIDTLLVDKTGTLTEGKPELVAAEPMGDADERELLRLAAGIERASEHPLASAIVKGARHRGVDAADAADFESITGQGVLARHAGKPLALGNHALMDRLEINISDAAADRAEQLRTEGQTVMFMAAAGRLIGLLGVADPIKTTTADAVAALRDEGIEIIMVTGDNPTTARAVARNLGIERVEADVLPQDKMQVVESLQAQGRRVAMAGDGINDAPALAAADVGIAMGTGTDVAMQSAGITLVKGDLRGIARARRLSRATMRNIRQNLFFAFLYNALGIPIAAGVLYPVTGILMNPMLAAAAMSASDLCVVGNALRLRHAKL